MMSDVGTRKTIITADIHGMPASFWLTNVTITRLGTVTVQYRRNTPPEPLMTLW